MEEKNKIALELKKCGIDEKICNSRCSICNSGYLVDIHKLRKDGMKFESICSAIFKKHSYEISVSSLSRHFSNYANYKTNVATNILKNETIDEITSQSVHLKKTVELLDLAYDRIISMMKNNSYKIDIADLEKLAKIRYQILNGENLDEKNILAVFQKATSDYGLDVQQGVLFKQ